MGDRLLFSCLSGVQLQEVSFDTQRILKELSALSLTKSLGPFKSVADFNSALVDIFVGESQGQDGPYIRGMVNAHKHEIVFTHADLKADNIIVKDGRVAAILDWEMAGWYPEYWEFAKAFYMEHFADDWGSHLLGVLTPYFCEHLMHLRLMSVLW
jgi:hypothetical protein